MLDDYNKETGCLRGTDISIAISITNVDTIIQHESEEFGTNGHIHCGNGLAYGIKQLVELYLEKLIWKFEDRDNASQAKD